ncbi:hypothetical protein BKA57DRAFT_252501 [Linnemannia elongata]|nr:hypothetical protein BKA57DRAFT_252501 [Linnemannia elongata]
MATFFPIGANVLILVILYNHFPFATTSYSPVPTPSSLGTLVLLHGEFSLLACHWSCDSIMVPSHPAFVILGLGEKERDKA